MSEENQRAGLGKVIYSVDERITEETEDVAKAESREVEEAVEESFPASDPPGFNKGAASDPA